MIAEHWVDSYLHDLGHCSNLQDAQLAPTVLTKISMSDIVQTRAQGEDNVDPVFGGHKI